MVRDKDALIASVQGIAAYMPPQLELLIECCERVNSIPGDVAEVGVFKGGSAKVMAEVMPNKDIHLFDTFDGMPKQWKEVDGTWYSEAAYRIGDNRGALAACQQLLAARHGIHYYVGVFPQTATEEVSDRSFVLAHLDCDLYVSIESGLNWFWPRMRKGGMIVVHDCFTQNAPGVLEALKEFSLAMRVPFQAYVYQRMATLTKP